MPTKIKTKLAIVDDHPAVVDGLRYFLEAQAPVQVTQTFCNGDELLEKLEAENTDILILDINIPGTNGLGCLKKLEEKTYPLKVIVYSTSSNEVVLRNCLQLNVCGYVLKDDATTELIAAVQKVSEGGCYYSKGVEVKVAQLQKNMGQEDEVNMLSEREQEILKGLAKGLTAAQIGDTMCISKYTVETHKRNIMLKLNCHTTAQVVHYAIDTLRM